MDPLATTMNELDETVAVEPGGTLYVDLDRGAVEVTSHDAHQVRIEARARGWAAWSFEFDLARQGNDVRLGGEIGDWGLWLFGPRVKVRAWVPRAYSVDIRTGGGRIHLAAVSGRIFAETSGGAIEIEGAEGPVALHTSGGAIRAADVDGSLRADTSGGRIEVARVTGDVQAHTSGGAITIAQVAGQIQARTSGGRIEIREAASHTEAVTSGGAIYASFTGAPSGNLETSGGSVEVRIPKDAGAQLEAETKGGRVEIEPTIRVQGRIEPRHVVGQINAGGAPLRLHTSGGSIHVRAV